MSTINDDNKVTCVSCGHVNYVHTDQVSVRVLDLQQTDVGLMVSTRGHSGILLKYYFNMNSDVNKFEGYLDIEDSLMFEMDSVRTYISDPNTMVTVFRPKQ